MSRMVLLLACLPAFCTAQRFTLGPIEFEADADGIIVQYHGHEWKPDLSKLTVRVADCRPVAWDEFNEILYFTAQTVVLGYDLRSEQVKRIVDNYEHPYDGPGAVSPLGRHVVLISHDTCGGCCASSYLVIVDTQARKQTSYHLPAGNIASNIASNEAARITSVRWTGQSVLEYSAEVRTKLDCGASRKMTGRFTLVQNSDN